MRDFFRKIGFDRKDFWLVMFWIGLIMINLVLTPTPQWYWIVQGFMFWFCWKMRNK